MKKIFAAAALASSMLIASGPAFASKEEVMVPVEFEVSTDSQPMLDTEGNVTLDEDGSPKFTETNSFSPKPRTAQVCVADEKGEKYTVEVRFMIAASAADMGVDTNGIDEPGPALDKAVEVIQSKMTPETLNKAAAFIQEGLNLSIGKHTYEEITGQSSPEHMVEDLEAIFEKIVDGKRLDDTKPSFEEETGITIAAVSIQPVGTQKGCKP